MRVDETLKKKPNQLNTGQRSITFNKAMNVTLINKLEICNGMFYIFLEPKRNKVSIV